MTRKLEEEFNLPHMDEMDNDNIPATTEDSLPLQSVEEALSISEKINGALQQVRGMEAHDSEMDTSAKQAIESYEQLMSLGMNMTDMAAGPVFNNAANMLKIALEAKDSKVTRKLKQVDLMLKKANLDQRAAAKGEDSGGIPTQANVFDRNELLKILGEGKSDKKDK
jgi:hypothetical protein